MNVPAVGASALFPAIAAFNTLGNMTSKSRLERTVFAATTSTLAVLCGYVALTGSAMPGAA
jgi:hypothetical protein